MNPTGHDPNGNPPGIPPDTPPGTPQPAVPPRGHRRGRGRRTAGGVAWLPPTRRPHDSGGIYPRTVAAVLILNLAVTVAVLVILLIRP